MERQESPSLDRRRLLETLRELGSHSVYYPAPVVEKLINCGLQARVAEDERAIFVENVRIDLTQPEWGRPGISPVSVLVVVYELSTGRRPESTMSGRGFWFKDVLQKLAKHWRIEDMSFF